MCNCADALIRTTICKHIHLISRFNLKTVDGHNETSPDQTVDLLDDDTFQVEDIKGQDTSKRHVSETALLENLQEKSQLCDTAVFRQEVQTQLSVNSTVTLSVYNTLYNHISCQECCFGYVTSQKFRQTATKSISQAFCLTSVQTLMHHPLLMHHQLRLTFSGNT